LPSPRSSRWRESTVSELDAARGLLTMCLGGGRGCTQGLYPCTCWAHSHRARVYTWAWNCSQPPPEYTPWLHGHVWAQLLVGLGFVVLSAEHGTCTASVTTQSLSLGLAFGDAQSVPAPSFGEEMCVRYVGHLQLAATCIQSIFRHWFSVCKLSDLFTFCLASNLSSRTTCAHTSTALNSTIARQTYV